MDLGIRGKVAMVAAGSKGLGRAAALALAAEGCAVSVCGRGGEALAAVRAELEALGVPALGVVADVAKAEDLARWHEATAVALGPVQILVTNTGGPKAAGFSGLSDDDWAAGVDSTLMNVVRLSRLVLPGMRAARSGGASSTSPAWWPSSRFHFSPSARPSGPASPASPAPWPWRPPRTGSPSMPCCPATS